MMASPSLPPPPTQTAIQQVVDHVRCTEQPVAHVERFGDLQRSQIKVYHPFHGVATRRKLFMGTHFGWQV